MLLAPMKLIEIIDSSGDTMSLCTALCLYFPHVSLGRAS